MAGKIDWNKFTGYTFKGVNEGTSVTGRVVRITQYPTGVVIVTEPLLPDPKSHNSLWKVITKDLPEEGTETGVRFRNGWEIFK